MLLNSVFHIAFKLASSAASAATLTSSTKVTSITITPEVRRRLIESIVRVDHAGELAADQIYAGQLAILHSNPRVAPIIEHMWKQEREHLDTMERLLAKYNVKPTIFAPLCSLAGYVLGMFESLVIISQKFFRCKHSNYW